MDGYYLLRGLMAQLVIVIPNPILPRVANGFALTHGYTGENLEKLPETKEQFMQRIVSAFIKEAVKQSEIDTAKNVAGKAAALSVETDIILG